MLPAAVVRPKTAKESPPLRSPKGPDIDLLRLLQNVSTWLQPGPSGQALRQNTLFTLGG